MVPSRKRSLRRAILGTLGAAVMFGPALFSGCATNFSPAGKIDTLRVLAVTVDKPYVNTIGTPAKPPDTLAKPPTEEELTVNFEMEVYDAYGVNTEGSERPIKILWIGGCFNPQGDQYSLCAEPLVKLFQAGAVALAEAVQNNAIPKFPPGLPLGWGKKFSMSVPADLLASRPPPDFGPHYALGYVFFLACAGDFGIVENDPAAAGTFPIGCFVDGQPVGADSFVPGYTQFYAFADGRLNKNPTITSLTLDGEELPEDFAAIPSVPPCDVPPQERNLPASCSREDAFVACTPYEIKVEVPEGVGEDDPDAKGSNGEQLSETVWVNYYTDTGDFGSDIKLINDPTTGYQDPHEVQWIPPAEPGLSTIWAVVRDARGGSSVVVRHVRIESPAP